MFGENNNYHHISNAYREYELEIEKDAAVAGDRFLVDAIAFRLVKNAFAYCFKEARLSTTGAGDIEHNQYCSQILTFVKALTSKDGDLLSHIDIVDESEAEVENISPHHHLFNNHDVAANKGEIKGQLPPEHKFESFKTFYKDS